MEKQNNIKVFKNRANIILATFLKYGVQDLRIVLLKTKIIIKVVINETDTTIAAYFILGSMLKY
jgi:hypothetical protein